MVTVCKVLHIVKRFVWDISVLTQLSYYCDFFCLGPASCICDHHLHRWVRYIDTKNYGFKVCVRLFSFYSVQLLLWLILFGDSIKFFIITIVMYECAILIPRQLWFCVCHCCYCLLIYENVVILLCFISNWPMVQWWNVG